MTFHIGYLIRMATKDLVHEWTVSAAICLTITSVAAPIAVLWGLYNGIIGEIFAELRSDPAAREIRLEATGSTRFRDPWFAEVQNWQEVSFITPSTRYASTQVQAFDASGDHEARANLLPTGPTDPLFAEGTPPPTSPVDAGISRPLAEALRLSPGDTVTIEITRTKGGIAETAYADLAVTHVALESAYDGDALFVTLPLLIAVEEYKDGAAAPLFNVGGDPAKPRNYYPDFRLYARDISDVAPLMARLAAPPHELSVTAQTGRIKFAEELSADLQRVIGAVALLGLLGLTGGLWNIQWSMAARRRRILAVLNLIGFRRWSLISLPVIQAAILGLIGAGLTALTALLFAWLINTWLGAALGTGAARITPEIVLAITMLILFVSIIPALVIGLYLCKLEPSDEIRET